MSDPVLFDMVADRNCPFATSVSRVGVNWFGASIYMQIKTVPDSPSAPLVDASGYMAIAYAGVDTVANHVASHGLSVGIYGHTNPTTGQKYAAADSVAFSKININIPGIALDEPYIPLPEEIGEPLKLAYDLRVSPSAGALSAGTKEFYGAFILRGTVTQ